jgi:hypothetical protein
VHQFAIFGVCYADIIQFFLVACVSSLCTLAGSNFLPLVWLFCERASLWFCETCFSLVDSCNLATRFTVFPFVLVVVVVVLVARPSYV